MLHIKFLVLLALVLSLGCASITEQKTEAKVEQKPSGPKYLTSDVYDSLKSQMPSPPAEKSKAQKLDEKAVLNAQKGRSDLDCKIANDEGSADPKAFYAGIKGPLSESEYTPEIAKFLAQVRSEIGPVIGKMKNDFPRKRPFAYMKKVKPCIPAPEDTGSFPSGHGTLGKLNALILSEIYPQYKDKLAVRAKEISQSRVLGGVHHPSDVEAGMKLGDLLYVELKKSKKFEDDLTSLRHLPLAR